MKKDVSYQIKEDEFIIKNYSNAKPFASFLPGIAGLWGKPFWAFYVNRGQAISCMGTKDKNGAILEFIAANKAYRLTSLQGFRTFIKANDKFYEPFRNSHDSFKNSIEQQMHITSHLLKLVDINKDLGLKITVEYFTLPNENIPAIARILSVENISNKTLKLECIDGLPIIIPYGTNDGMLKNMSRLAEGWFSGVLFYGENKIPVYKLKVEPEDSAEIVEIEQANFYLGYFFNKQNKVCFPEFIIDPEVVFKEQMDFILPMNFINNIKFKNDPETTAKNKTPCGMGYFKTVLQSKKTFKYFSVIGNTPKLNKLSSFFNKVISDNYLFQKKQENKALIADLCNNILTKSSSPEFDNYCKQTFLDNLLRGGYPITLGKDNYKKNVYVYSRIHGDMEREYNNFVIMPEYFSRGNGAYRDVNQNRRNDVFFNPDIKDSSLIFFLNLIQIDGFNPLSIMGSKFKINMKNEFLKLFRKEDKKKIKPFTLSAFSMRDLFNFIENNNIRLIIKKEKFPDDLMKFSEKIDHALPGAGYWSDHWHYNTDLMENYLSIFPEKAEEMLLKKEIFTFYDNPMVVLPRSEKYVIFNNSARQIQAVYLHPDKEKMITRRKENKNIVRTKHGRGSIYKTNLLGKFLCLIANKFASLDPEGVGIEMEADKPNWKKVVAIIEEDKK